MWLTMVEHLLSMLDALGSVKYLELYRLKFD
jgi:hypothetical protein